MKAKIKTKELAEAMAKAVALIGSGQDSKFCQIEAGEKFIVKANNKVSQIECFVNAEIKEQGQFGVDSKKLLQLCKAAKSEFIEIKVDKQISIKSGNSKARFAVVESVYFEIDMEGAKNIGGIELVNQGIRVLKFCGDNESRRNLMGVNYSSNGAVVKITGADAFRIAQVCESASVKYSAIVPRKSMAEIGGIGLTDSARVLLSDRYILIEDDWGRYKSQLLESEYPNLDSIIAQEGDYIKIPMEELSNSLKFMNVISSDSAIMAAKFIFSGQTLEIVAKEGDIAESGDTIQLVQDCNDLKVGLNVKYLIDAIDATGGEFLNMLVTEEIKPVKIDGGDISIVIMPTKIKW